MSNNRPSSKLLAQISPDGRCVCRTVASSENRDSEQKAVKFEVRKIEVRPLGVRMGWWFADDEA